MNIRKLVWLLPCILFALPAHAAASDGENGLNLQVKMLMHRIETLESKQTEIIDSNMQQTIPAASENMGNPSISVIGTFAGSSMRSESGIHSEDFLPLSEGEFVFGAAVDAHTRLDITVTGNNAGLAVEEGYLTANLPDGFRLRAGRKFIPIGRVNQVHPHALPYADVPNGLVNLFGSEKLVGEGVFIDHPLYIGDSAHSFLFGFFQNANDVAFDPTGNNQFGEMVRWTGMWDMNDTTTLELGTTYINGRNHIAGSSQSHIFGGHVAVKDSQFNHSGWSMQAEFNRNRMDGVNQSITDGAYLLGEYDFNRNWLAFACYDSSSMTGTSNHEYAYSVGAGWKLSEFQSITLQYKHTSNALTQTATNLGIGVGQSANELFFRWVVAIGPHRPHSY